MGLLGRLILKGMGKILFRPDYIIDFESSFGLRQDSSANFNMFLDQDSSIFSSLSLESILPVSIANKSTVPVLVQYSYGED